MRIWVVVDGGCQECGVPSEPVSAHWTPEEAEKAREERDRLTGGWREGGQTDAHVHEFEIPPAPTSKRGED